MKKTLSYLLFLVILLLSCRIDGAEELFETLPVGKIQFLFQSSLGKEEFDDLQVFSKMKTREGEPFSQADFDGDLKNLSLEFDRVDPELKAVDGKLNVTLKLWSKPKIRSITFQGNKKMTTKALSKELATPLSSIYDRKSFNTAFHKLKTLYVKKGFFEVLLDYEPRIDPLTNEIDITICIEEGRSGKIEEICFFGFTKEEEKEIAEKMVTKRYNLIFSWFSEEGTYREDAVHHDEMQIIHYMQNRGFADATVRIEILECPKSDRIKLHICCDRGELYTVHQLAFTGNCLFSDDQIFQEFTFVPGDPYSPEEIRNTIGNIQNLYGRRGYIDSLVTFEPKLNDNETYDVDFVIDEAEQYRVGLIKVFGNSTTQTEVILHETLLCPGEIFNTEKIKLTEKRLENIGYFKKVNVFAVRCEDSEIGGIYRDVHIEVEETSTGRFGLFLGFSTSDSFFGGVTLSENNFNVQGISKLSRSGTRALRGGGEYLNLSIQAGLRSRNYELSWTKPYFMNTKWSLGFDLENSFNNYIDRHIDINALGLTTRIGKQLNPFVRLQLHHRLRNSWVNWDEGKEETAKKIAEDPHLAELTKYDGLVSAFGISLTYDSTDSTQFPTKGFRSTLEAELAGPGGQYTFWALAYLNTYYYQLKEDLVLKYRADLRFIFPFGGTTPNSMPLDERLYLGGGTLVRGYKPYKLGPTFEGTHIPKGGVTEQYYSVELNQHWSKRFDGFLFMDVGFLTEKDFDFTLNDYRATAGFGLRITLLDSLPAVSIGMGFPINPPDRNDVKRFFLQFGCKF